MGNRHGVSYQKRVADINRIYDLYVKKGVPNREMEVHISCVWYQREDFL